MEEGCHCQPDDGCACGRHPLDGEAVINRLLPDSLFASDVPLDQLWKSSDQVRDESPDAHHYGQGGSGSPSDEEPIAGHPAKGIKTLKRVADEQDRPDLARYFEELSVWGPEVSNAERIKICRAYASYLASIAPPRAVKRRAVKNPRK